MSLRILLLTPRFYGLESRIKTILEESGNEVVWIENKSLPFDYHGTRAKFRKLRRIYYFLFFPRERHIAKELKRLKNKRFDILFAINGHLICRYLLKRLLSENTFLNTILYLWDSFSMYSWRRELELIQKVYTFDYSESERYHLDYKPVFFLGRTNLLTSEIKNDLFFAGKYNLNRLKIIDKISDQIEGSDIKSLLWLGPAEKNILHSSILYKILKRLKSRSVWIENYLLDYEVEEGILKRKYFLSQTLIYEDVQKESLMSNVILDLPFHGQSGYTHRLIEALANGTKVITTNKNIAKEKFFNSDQIKILNINDPEIDIDWIKTRKKFDTDIYFQNLELSDWINSMIRFNNEKH